MCLFSLQLPVDEGEARGFRLLAVVSVAAAVAAAAAAALAVDERVERVAGGSSTLGCVGVDMTEAAACSMSLSIWKMTPSR